MEKMFCEEVKRITSSLISHRVKYLVKKKKYFFSDFMSHIKVEATRGICVFNIILINYVKINCFTELDMTWIIM